MGIFNNLSLTNKVIKLTIVNSLIVRNSNLKKLTTFSNNKMVCNKITFVFVLVGLISISCMVSSAALGDDTTEGTTAAPTTQKATTQKATTQKATTQKATTPKATTGSVDPTATTTESSGAGYPKITYGMLFSFISAILLLSA